MSVPGLSRVLDILRSLYPTVQTIEDYVDGVTLSNGRKAALVEEADTSRFKSLLRGLIVCIEKQMRDAPSGDQVFFSIVPRHFIYHISSRHSAFIFVTDSPWFSGCSYSFVTRVLFFVVYVQLMVSSERHMALK